MGRGSKTIITSSGVDRRAAGYYSTPDFVAEFLSAFLLKLRPDARTVCDPCVGNEELLVPFADKGLVAQGFDVVRHKTDYGCGFEQKDFLKYYCRWQQDANRKSLPFDLWVANPPYNCHEADYVRTHKQLLKTAFDDVGVANTFAMFISAIIEMAQEGACIGILTYDSFLTTRMHAPLRRKILNSCNVHLLALCPTDLFRGQGADVRSCLIVLSKGTGHQANVKIANRPLSKDDFAKRLAADAFTAVPLPQLLLSGDKDLHEFVVDCPADVKALFQSKRLGELFACVTGISTGNDRRYLCATAKPPYTVPFYKNPGSRRFRCQHDLYIDADFLQIADRVPNFIVRNRHLLFREGISCSSMGVSFGAAYMPPGGVFGVNANVFCEQADLYWLLAYLNSSLVTYFVRGVLLRTNMITSGYVSRIPVISLSAANRRRLSQISRRAVSDLTRDSRSYVRQIDEIVFTASGISKASQTHIAEFCAELVRRT